MRTHEPDGYVCPFCTLVRGGEPSLNRQADVVLRDEHTTAFVAPKWWPNNAGHVLVVPNEHHENIYVIPNDALARVHTAAKVIASALVSAYGCDGTSTRQHNEPGGNQDVWHFHVHVFPRYTADELYLSHSRTRWTTPDERAPYAERLRRVLRPVQEPR